MQSGAILLDGIDVRDLQQGSLRGAVAVVPQVSSWVHVHQRCHMQCFEAEAPLQLVGDMQTAYLLLMRVRRTQCFLQTL